MQHFYDDGCVTVGVIVVVMSMVLAVGGVIGGCWLWCGALE